MAINCIFRKKNIERTQRNGMNPENKTIVKYITQTGTNGVSGDDAFNVFITPQAKIFNAGPVSQTDIISVYAFRGTNQLGTYVDASAILGEDDGLTCTVSNNGTVNTSVTVTVSNTLDSDGGTIVIPVKYATDTYDASTVWDASLWDASIHAFADTSTYYSWTLVKSTASNWNLDLTNENASINADASGNIYATAVRPTCTAKLTRGTEDVSTAVYYISTPNVQNVQGLSINSSSGVLTFNDGSASTPFSFDGTSVEITVTAKVDNETKGTKIMTVSKSLAGKDGDGSPAVSYWLDFSADAVKVNKAGTPTPSSVTATAYKQLGGDAPQTATECWMKWGYNTTDPSTATSSYTYTINSVNTSKDYITFKLYKDTSTYLGESETIPILKDGLDGSAGSPGSVGPAGPVIRGPILWNTNLRRRFCSGSGTGATDSSYIDIIYYDPSGGVDYHYYMCNTSYTQSNSLHTWSAVSSYWTQAQGEYDFIATQLLLANDAKIKFLTNNEFYLTDADGNIHGGGRAATSDSSIIFWAGAANGSTNINEAPFQVDYNGNIKATSGIFSGFVQYPYKDVLELSSIPTFDKDNITRYATYTFDASTQYANLISRTIQHYKPSSSQGTAVARSWRVKAC